MWRGEREKPGNASDLVRKPEAQIKTHMYGAVNGADVTGRA